MSRIDDLAREIAELRRDIRNTRLEAADAAVSAAQRRHSARLAVVEEELRRSWRRLDPDTSLLRWHPRAGEAVNVDIGSGLLERLRTADPVADSLGNTDPFVGQSNLLDDPSLQYVQLVLPVVAAENTRGQWFAKRVLNSGTDPQADFVLVVARDGSGNPLNSNMAQIRWGGFPTAAYDVDFYIRNRAVGAIQLLPYLVASIRVTQWTDGGTFDAFTTLNVYLQIVDNAGTVLAESAPLDWLTTFTEATDPVIVRQLYVALANPDDVTSYNFRLRIHAVATAGNNEAFISFGEPSMHLSYSPDPMPFSPYLARWVPDHVISTGAQGYSSDVIDARLGDDTRERFLLQNDGNMFWGPGNSGTDVRLIRVGANELRLDPGNTFNPARLLTGDVLPYLDASWVITYNGDGTVASATRSGEAGAKTVTVTYAASQVASIVTTVGGHTITTTPTYTAGKITSLARAVV